MRPAGPPLLAWGCCRPSRRRLRKWRRLLDRRGTLRRWRHRPRRPRLDARGFHHRLQFSYGFVTRVNGRLAMPAKVIRRALQLHFGLLQ
jgi:hypothetical protein